ATQFAVVDAARAPPGVRVAATRGPALWSRDQRLLRHLGGNAARLSHSQALQGTAFHGDVSTKFLATRARRAEPLDHQAYCQRPEQTRRAGQRSVRAGLDRARHPCGGVTLQMADRDVWLVAATSRPGRPVLWTHETRLMNPEIL